MRCITAVNASTTSAMCVCVCVYIYIYIYIYYSRCHLVIHVVYHCWYINHKLTYLLLLQPCHVFIIIGSDYRDMSFMPFVMLKIRVYLIVNGLFHHCNLHHHTWAYLCHFCCLQRNALDLTLSVRMCY